MSTGHLSGIDWEDAFVNAGHIPGGDSYPEKWAAHAAEFRASTPCECDLEYGSHPRERFDLFQPKGASKGLAVIVHGGFWRAFDKSYWSDLALWPLAQGWSVALPSYTLAPEARISDMTRQIARMIETAAQRVPGPICLAGHSAGGHLVTRQVCTGAALGKATAQRIQRVVSISGVHDLRPLRLNSMNKVLHLDDAEAEAESPVLHAPNTQARVIAWVGLNERPEFLRQSAVLAEAWRAQGGDVDLVADPDRHHFDVIDGLKDPDHPLTQALIGL